MIVLWLILIVVMLKKWQFHSNFVNIKRRYKLFRNPNANVPRRRVDLRFPIAVIEMPLKRLKKIYKINKWNRIMGTNKKIPYDTDMADRALKELYYKAQRIYHASIGRTEDNLDDLIGEGEGSTKSGRPRAVSM